MSLKLDYQKIGAAIRRIARDVRLRRTRRGWPECAGRTLRSRAQAERPAAAQA